MTRIHKWTLVEVARATIIVAARQVTVRILLKIFQLTNLKKKNTFWSCHDNLLIEMRILISIVPPYIPSLDPATRRLRLRG